MAQNFVTTLVYTIAKSSIGKPTRFQVKKRKRIAPHEIENEL